jgi:hypothetical protein
MTRCRVIGTILMIEWAQDYLGDLSRAIDRLFDRERATKCLAFDQLENEAGYAAGLDQSRSRRDRPRKKASRWPRTGAH